MIPKILKIVKGKQNIVALIYENYKSGMYALFEKNALQNALKLRRQQVIRVG